MQLSRSSPMRSIGIGLAVALMLSTLAPVAAWAAKPPPTPPISKADRDSGMKAAPALIAAGKIDCQLADARKLGESVDPKTKVKSTLYELACAGAEGVVVQDTANQPPLVFTCLESSQPRPDGKPNSTACILPGNADPKAGLVPLIAKTGVPCTPDKARPLGHNSTASLFELVCHESVGGFILQTSAPPRADQPVVMNPCINFNENQTVKCELTDRATQLSVVDKLTAEIGKPCSIKDRSYIGTSAKTGSMYYEVACTEGHGYVLEQLASGALNKAIDCVDAEGVIAGGCKLTDTRQAKTEQNNLYAKMSKKAGYDCDVSGYAPLPTSADFPAHSDVVEITCANRPDGAIAVFPASATDPVQIFDCAHSELEGYRCSLSKPSAAYDKLTAELVAFGKKTCTVSNARAVGVSAEKHGYTEVACSDGLQGYMIEYTVKPLEVKSVIICSEAKGIAGGCTLPGNTPKKS
jgi:hypothetical protein